MQSSLSPQETQQQLLGEGVYLVDVRSAAEYRGKRLPDSDHRPIDKFNEKQAREVAKTANGKRVCFICQSGKRSKMALSVWQKAGCAGNATELDGGLNAWASAGLPLEEGEGGVISIERQVRIVAGSLVFLGVILGAFVSPLWLILPGFVGAGLTFAGITDTCGMGLMLARMPWNR